jgi:hypothetical protein
VGSAAVAAVGSAAGALAGAVVGGVSAAWGGALPQALSRSALSRSRAPTDERRGIRSIESPHMPTRQTVRLVEQLLDAAPRYRTVARHVLQIHRVVAEAGKRGVRKRYKRAEV